MKLPPFDYPFNYDGVSYFGDLAYSLLRGTAAGSLAKIWGDGSQAPLYFSIQLGVAKLFGLSYRHALLAHALICAIVVALVGLTLNRLMPPVGHRRSTLVLNCLTALFMFGVFSVMPGNVFDFRLDILGSLLLALAVASIPLSNPFTALCFGTAILERFHNFSILGGTLGIIGMIALVRDRQSFWKRIAWPSLGLIAPFVLHWNSMYTLLQYYVLGHFTHNASSRGFTDWRTPGFFKFYPKAFLEQYSLLPLWLLLAAILMAGSVFWTSRKRSSASFRFHPAVFPLCVSGSVAFALLTLDPTRNNTGVLRYAVVPFALALGILFTQLVERLAVFDLQRRKLIFGTLTLFGLVVWGEWRRIQAFWDHFDYAGMRQSHYASQIDRTLAAAREDWLGRDLNRPFRFVADFHTDLNLNPFQWAIFWAAHGYPEMPMSVGGTSHSLEKFGEEALPHFQVADYVLLDRDGGCRKNSLWIPANVTFEANAAVVKKTVLSRCPTILSTIQFDTCTADFRKCTDAGDQL